MTSLSGSPDSPSADDPARNVESIKTAIANRIRATDARVRIHSTGYFNHSFVPDIVLEWTEEQEERPVFLRTSFNVPDLSTDVQVLGDEEPILLTLATFEDRVEADGVAQLNERSRGRRTLITNPDGLAAMAEQTNYQPVVSLFTHAVLQGGRGILDSNTASIASRSISEGFLAAQQADASVTGRAVETSEDLLDPQRAGNINRLLHAVWIGSGASGTTFPGASGIAATLDVESLRFLLLLPRIDDPEFWRRLGRNMSLERVADLRNFEESDNFQLLMRASAGNFLGKACRTEELDTPVSDASWSVRDSALTLNIGSRKIYFVPNRVKQLPSLPDSVAYPTVDEVRRRANENNIALTEVRLASGTSAAAFSGEGDVDVSQDDTLDRVESALGEDFHVHTVTARLGAERTVECNFRTMTGAGRTNARFQLSELAAVAVPLLLGMTRRERAVLREAMELSKYDLEA